MLRRVNYGTEAFPVSVLPRARSRNSRAQRRWLLVFCTEIIRKNIPHPTHALKETIRQFKSMHLQLSGLWKKKGTKKKKQALMKQNVHGSAWPVRFNLNPTIPVHLASSAVLCRISVSPPHFTYFSFFFRSKDALTPTLRKILCIQNDRAHLCTPFISLYVWLPDLRSQTRKKLDV